jgi:hypothetical protein
MENSHQITAATISPTFLQTGVAAALAAPGFRCSSPLSAAPSLRCSTGSCRLLHRFLQVQHPVSTATQVLAGAAPSLHCSTGYCRCSTQSPLLHRFLQVQHPVSTVSSSTQSLLLHRTLYCRLLHRFLQVQHPVSTAPQVLAGAAPNPHCSTGSCRCSTQSPLLHKLLQVQHPVSTAPQGRQPAREATGSSSTRSP